MKTYAVRNAAGQIVEFHTGERPAFGEEIESKDLARLLKARSEAAEFRDRKLRRIGPNRQERVEAGRARKPISGGVE